MSWRTVWREVTIWGLLLLFLATFGLVVWATHHPEHPALVRAAGWPAVGPLVERFRAYYGVDGAGDGAGDGPGDGAGGAVPSAGGVGEGAGGEGRPPRILYLPETGLPGLPGAPGAPGGDGGAGEAGVDLTPPAWPTAPASARREVWVAAGEEVRAAPAPDSPLLGRHPVFERLEVLERSGEWARVASGVGEGWVRVTPDEEVQYPLGSGLVRPLPLPGAAPDTRELQAARDLLGVQGPSGRLGPYLLYTDVLPPSRLFQLDRLAGQLEPVYIRRYGRPLEGEPAEAVLVFAGEATYRLYQAREARLRGLPAAGHSGRGMVALWVGDRPPHELASTLVHELGHVLNRRAVGPALPPWLDEGLAEDLSLSRVTAAGDLRPDQLGGAVVRGPRQIEYQGALASLRSLDAAYARARPPRLARLTGLDWEGFVRSEERSFHYAHAGYFVRYLVETPELAEGFRRFLDRVAAGGPATGEALRRELDRPWKELDAGLADWVRGKVLETAVEGEAEAGSESGGA